MFCSNTYDWVAEHVASEELDLDNPSLRSQRDETEPASPKSGRKMTEDSTQAPAGGGSVGASSDGVTTLDGAATFYSAARRLPLPSAHRLIRILSEADRMAQATAVAAAAARGGRGGAFSMAQESRLSGRSRAMHELLSLVPFAAALPLEPKSPEPEDVNPHAEPGTASSNGVAAVSAPAPPQPAARTSDKPTTPPGQLILLQGEQGSGRACLLQHFRAYATQALPLAVVFSVRACETDVGSIWVAVRALLKQILEEAAAVEQSGQPVTITPSGVTRPALFTPTSSSMLMALFRELHPDLVPFLPLLNTFLPYSFRETDHTAYLGPRARAEFTLRLFVALLKVVIRDNPFIVLVSGGEHLDSLSWTALARIALHFPRSMVVSTVLSFTQHVETLKSAMGEWNGKPRKAAAAPAKPAVANFAPASTLPNQAGMAINAAGKAATAATVAPVSQAQQRTAFLSSLQGVPYSVITLSPMSRLETKAYLMNALAVVDVSSQLLAAVMVQTKGHPQHIEGVVQLLLSRGRVDFSENAWMNVGPSKPLGGTAATTFRLDELFTIVPHDARDVRCAVHFVYIVL